MGGRNSKQNKGGEEVEASPGSSMPGDSVRGFSETAFKKPDWAIDHMANDSTKAAFLSQLHEAKLGAVIKAIDSIEYGMFWKTNDHNELVWETSTSRTSDPDVLSFLEASRHCVFKKGQGMPGKALKTSKTIWVSNCSKASTGDFERNLDAQAAGVNTVFAICKEGGVAEFGMKANAPRDEGSIARAISIFDAKVDMEAVKAGTKPWTSIYSKALG